MILLISKKCNKKVSTDVPYNEIFINGSVYYNAENAAHSVTKLFSKLNHGVIEGVLAIAQVEGKNADKIKNPKDGDYCGYFTKYYKGEGWCWVGPVF